MPVSTNRVEFTKEMKKDYTILMPNMCNIHFKFVKNVFKTYGFKAELLTSTDQKIIDEGLKYVHNDTCYPALLCIGQMMDALHSGKYDLNKVALVMTQTGGGCRASNYIHLLRKALEADGLGHIPVISLSAGGLEKNSGFKITISMVRKALAALAYGDLLMLLSNQTRPYEINAGETDCLVDEWIERLCDMFSRHKAYSRRDMARRFSEITESFGNIPLEERDVIKVGIVGEIYVKYSALANNHLEEFLAQQGCEVMVPGIMGFMLYCARNGINDIDLYGGTAFQRRIKQIIYNFLSSYEDYLIKAVKDHGKFLAPWPNEKLHDEGAKVIGKGCKMGEGWLLTAEMVELINHGYGNIVCAQPFGCLPNHIVGKGMIRKLRNLYDDANIVAIDYDPGATKVNQENRIKLMLSVARENMEGKELKTVKKEEGKAEKIAVAV